MTIKRLKHWLKQSLIAVDQLANAFIFLGFADETISARLWRNTAKNIYWSTARIVVDLLFLLIERDHCYNAYLSEIYRRQYPLAYTLNQTFKPTARSEHG